MLTVAYSNEIIPICIFSIVLNIKIALQSQLQVSYLVASTVH